MVDYAGQTVPVTDRESGEIRQAQIFVAASAASNYTYLEATWSQGLADWIGAHRRCFEFMGGVHALVIPDNTKTGVTSPCWYEPEINPTYQELASHYGTAVVPTRIRRPRDKAKVETAVQGVERQILARLRHRTFFSLAELNQALRELLVEYNRRPFAKLEGCRHSLFEQLEKPALKPLPIHPYRSIASILKHGLDRQSLTALPTTAPISHANIRGAHYYDKEKNDASSTDD
jgi:transposase